MTSSDEDLIYGVKAIAAALGIPRRAAQHQVDTQRLPTFRLGRTVCARRSTLNAWLAEQEAKGRAG